MLKRIFYIVLGFILGLSSILYIYGDLNKDGILNLYSKYKETQKIKKEKDALIIKEYIQMSIDNSKKEVKEKNKWQKKIKNKKTSGLFNKNNFNNIEKLDGTKLTENDLEPNKHLILVGLPVINPYGISNNKSPEEWIKLQKLNMTNILKVKEELGNTIQYGLLVDKNMFINEFSGNTVKLIKYIKEKYPTVNFNIYIVDVLNGFGKLLISDFIYFDYLIGEEYSEKYLEQFIYLINNQDRKYNNKELFPQKEYIMSLKMSDEAIKYYEKISNRKLTNDELKKNNEIKPKMIGYGVK